MNRNDIRIEVTGFEKYDIKKYSDRFSEKSKPFKTVAFATSYFPDDSELKHILKFYKSNVSQEAVVNRAYKQLAEVGILEVEETEEENTGS